MLMSKKIGIINSGISNLTSVYNAIKFIGYNAEVVNESHKLSNYSHIILPGVGAFGQGMTNLIEKGFVNELDEIVLKGNPILGICLGMQLLGELGEEFGTNKGLGFIPGIISKIDVKDSKLILPHVGWNTINQKKKCNLLYGIKEDASFYFVHSFAFADPNTDYMVATCSYGVEIPAIVQKDNVYGTQFHPEKSQKSGLQILKNFVEKC